MTKLVTAVAVMQLVERGVVSLDDDVREKVPELANIQILENMKQGIYIPSTSNVGSSIIEGMQVICQERCSHSFCQFTGR